MKKLFYSSSIFTPYIFLFPFYILLFVSSSSAQTVFEPINSGVYEFLDLMAQKGIIQFHDNIKPVSREYIAEKLEQIKEQAVDSSQRSAASKNKLTEVENEELKFYLKDFGMELSSIQHLPNLL